MNDENVHILAGWRGADCTGSGQDGGMTSAPAQDATSTPSTITTTRELTEAEKAFFVDQGYVKLRGILDPDELNHWGPKITEQVIALNTETVPLEERDTYGKAFLQIENIWRHDEAISRFVHSPDLARLAAQLLGVRSVRLYHDQALYKEPSGGITPWHCDQYYWPLSTDRTCTIWIPLQDTDSTMGPLTFLGGSQRSEEARDLAISDDSQQQIEDLAGARGFPRDDSPFQLGDCSFHFGWTLHGAGPNQSTEPRRVMTIIYIDADIEITEPINDNQRADHQLWLSGLPVGHVADGPLNPVLYPA